MARRAVSSFPFCFAAILACLLSAGCTGRPANFSGLSLSLSTGSTIGQGQTTTITAMLPNDTSGAGVTFTLIPPNPLPAEGDGTLTQTSKFTANYTAPAAVPAGTSFTVTVKATSVTFPGQAQTIAITVVGPPQVTTTSLPGGNVGSPYSATIDEAGGLPPFTWTISSGSLTTGLSLGSSNTSSVKITGTPTVQTNSNFTIKVTDSTGAFATQALTITIGPVVNLTLLQGNYTFTFSGFNASGAVVFGGVFTADGKGNLTNGIRDFNTLAGPPANQTFTGTYTLGTDNRGAITLASLTGPPVLDFAIDSTGSHGRFIEFDSSGIRGAGQIEKQSVTACTSTTIDGDYVFDVAGNTAAISGQSAAGPVAMAGRFEATPGVGSAGSLSLGEMDANAPNRIMPSFPPQLETLSGTFNTTTQAARCTINIVPQDLPGLNFSLYPISATQAFLVETDQVSSTAPFIATGEMDSQSGAPFSSPNAFSGTFVGGVPGQFLVNSSYVPDDAIIWLSSAGGGSFTMSDWENQGGTLTTFGVTAGTPQPVTQTYAVDSSGRVTSNLETPFSPTFYIISATQFVMVSNVQGEPMVGVFNLQSAGPFSAATIKGTFVEGTSAPTIAAVTDLSGVITLDGTSVVTGTQDESASTGNAAAQAVTGTYQDINSTFGNGTLTLTAPSAFSGIFLIVSPTNLVMIQSSTGPDPILLFLGN